MSKTIYCIAQFTPKKGKFDELFARLKALEPKTRAQIGCISYILTKHIKTPFATGDSMPIVFNESWDNIESFEKHCQSDDIVEFFETECIADGGLVQAYNVATYTDK